jgi:hypothetical protein
MTNDSDIVEPLLLLKRGANIRTRANAKQTLLYAAASTRPRKLVLAYWTGHRSRTDVKNKIGREGDPDVAELLLIDEKADVVSNNYRNYTIIYC